MDNMLEDYLRQKAGLSAPQAQDPSAPSPPPDPMAGFADLAQKAAQVGLGQDTDPAFEAAHHQDVESSRMRTLGDYLSRGASLIRNQPVSPSAPPQVSHDNMSMLQAQRAAGTQRLQKLVNAMQAMREAKMGPADVALKTAQATKATQEAEAGRFNLEDTSRLRTALAQGDSNATAYTRALASRLAGKDTELQKSISAATGQELSSLMPILEKAYAAEQSAQARREAAHMMMGGGLTPEALKLLATLALKTGNIPRIGGGASGTAAATSIANAAAKMDPEANLAGTSASYKADVGSLSALQKQADAVESFERTGLQNLDLFLQKAKQVVDTGSPLFNKGAREFAERVRGDPRMAGFITARQVAVQEIAKILSGNMGNMALSDSARKEASDLLKPDASLAQIEEATSVLRRDLANRKAGFRAQIGDIKSRASGTAPAEPDAAEPGGTAKIRVRRKSDGKTGTILPAEFTPDLYEKI